VKYPDNFTLYVPLPAFYAILTAVKFDNRQPSVKVVGSSTRRKETDGFRHLHSLLFTFADFNVIGNFEQRFPTHNASIKKK
jgi:hypothetical protein